MRGFGITMKRILCLYQKSRPSTTYSPRPSPKVNKVGGHSGCCHCLAVLILADANVPLSLPSQRKGH